MIRDIRLFINDMRESVNSILEFTKNMIFEEFCSNKLVSSAVIRQFEIIGEAAKKLPENFTAQYSDIPWSDIARMRDKMIHWYFEINYKIIWKTIKEDLPDLQIKLDVILKNL